MKRVPGLDGLRAVSILLVLCGHLDGTLGFYNNPAFWGHLGDIANLGVRVFFVISGYIITFLLLRETEKTGTISLKEFYFRRTIRIFPASYCFILFIALAYLFGVFQLNRGDLLHAVTYTMNFFPDRSWWVGHLWSLSVEEQFYLLWPATLLLLGTRKGLKAALAVILLAPLVRLGTAYFWVSQVPSIGNSFPTIADPIATGCLLAGYKDELLARPWFRKMIDSRLFFLVPLAAWALNFKPGGRIRWLILETLINLLIGLCVCRATVHTKDWAGRLLNSAPFVFVGVLSYSLYLWQQLFLNRDSAAWPSRFPQNLLLAFCAALLCHYVIEKPFLRLREARHVVPASAPAVFGEAAVKAAGKTVQPVAESLRAPS
ncbi:MAG TPA: acyltransferase [Candidatus Acidoferrum sp.]|nr:acyltransferase [Candidatus Acidoferrum sp.]